VLQIHISVRRITEVVCNSTYSGGIQFAGGHSSLSVIKYHLL